MKVQASDWLSSVLKQTTKVLWLTPLKQLLNKDSSYEVCNMCHFVIVLFCHVFLSWILHPVNHMYLMADGVLMFSVVMLLN